MNNGERSLAIFIDFENLALGFQSRRDRFDIVRVLERLVEKGKIVCKKAYADWNRFSSYTTMLHEAAIELIEIPRRGQSGKNSADIHLCVDAMDLAYSKEHINTFVVVSGDSDFSPLVSKLKELGKHVLGLGMQESTSDLLRDNCDEFIYYEDLGQAPTLPPPMDPRLPETKRKAFSLLLESLLALRRENKEVLWSSMVKDTMKRKKPSFNETYHGYRTFSELLEDAARHGLLDLDTDKRSRTYVVTSFGSDVKARPAAVSSHAEPATGRESGDVGAKKKSSRRRRSGKKPRTKAASAADILESEEYVPSDGVGGMEGATEADIARFEEAVGEPPLDDFDAEPIPDEEVFFPRKGEEFDDQEEEAREPRRRGREPHTPSEFPREP